MSEVEEKQINEKTEKAKKAKNRTSLKNIIGGYSGNGFLPSSDQIACADNGTDTVLHTQPLCLSATNDRD